MTEPAPRGPFQPRLQPLLRRTVQQFAVAITMVLLLVGLFVAYQLFRLRIIVLQMSEDVQPLLLSNETVALIERTAHVLRDVQTSLDDPEAVHKKQISWSEQLVALHSALDSNRRDLEAFIDALPADDPLHPSLSRSWALLRESTRITQEIAQSINHKRWDDVNTLIRRFFTVYEEYHLTQRFLVRQFEERRDQTLTRMLTALRNALILPGISMAITLLLVGLFARFVVKRVIEPIEHTAEGVLQFAQGDLHYRLQVSEHAADEVSHLRRIFNQMADQVQTAQLSLEQRVAERTYALQRRVAQIQAAADIARLLASLRSPELLLERTVRLIAERFGYYHVGIFLLDETGEWMELRAASSEGGQRMVQRKHRLRVGEEGLVGFVARTGNPRIVLDVEDDPLFVRPEELPLTRSEMALPLRVGGRILGVLDIQSTQPNAFAPEDVTTLRIVADQIAVALDNAFLLQRMERALDELHWTQRQLTRRGWEEFLRVNPAVAYHRDARGELTTFSRRTAALQQQERSRRFFELRLPIRLREQPIATLILRRSQVWTETEREMLNALSERLAVALEGARLYFIAQRRTAWLQAAVELGRLLRTWDETRLVQQFTHEVLTRFPLWRAVLYVYRVDQRVLEARAAAGSDWESLLGPPSHRVPLSAQEAVARVARQHVPLLLNTPESMQAYEDSAPIPAGQSRLLLPILLGDSLFGVLDLHAERPRAFLESDIVVLRLLADSLAAALVNAQLVARLRVLLHEQQRLQEALVQATARTSVDEALEVVVEALYELETPQSVAIYLPDERQPGQLRRRAFRLHPAVTEPWPESVAVRDDEAQGVAFVFAHQGALWCNGVRWREDGLLEGEASVLIVPILYASEILGVIAFRHARANAYTEDFWGLAHTAASAVGSLLSNLRLLEQVQRRSEQLQRLYDFTVTLSRYTHFEEVARVAVRRIREAFNAHRAGILLYEERRSLVRLIAADMVQQNGGRADDEHGLELPLLPGSPFYRMRQRPQVMRSSWTQLSQAPPEFRDMVVRRGVHSQVFAPLLVGGEVIGLVALGFAQEEPPLSTADLTLFEQMARQLSLAIELARLLEHLERRAQRERWVREITVRMRSSNDPLEILRLAVEGLREHLHLEEAQILLTRAPAASAPMAENAGSPEQDGPPAQASATEEEG